MSQFRKLDIDDDDESIVSNSSDNNVVQGSVIRDAIAYANHLGMDITLHMAGKEICIAPNADWYKVCEEFFD